MPAARLLAGRYQLETPLGRGAFGEVWRARDVTTRRHVAVKIVELGEIPDEPLLAEVIARFRREVVTAGQLMHPNIAAAYEAGRVANELFLAMELVEGASLARVIEQRRTAGIGLLPISSVLEIAGQACAGLAAAHAADVVHRDIKPSNLMVTPRLQVKIIDFGLARLLADRAPRLTLPSQRIGTPAYMSPEQAAGADVDSRADLYSLGCVLYELLAGEPPFTAPEPEDLLRMQLEFQPVPLSIRRADLPVGLEQLIDELMAKDPERRPARAELVNTRISAIRGVLPPGKPAHEADRATVNAAGQGQSAHRPATVARTTSLPDAMGDAGERTLPSGLTALPALSQPPPKRRRWRAAVGALVTGAILGAIGVVLWQRAHDQLKVTSVAVAPAQLPGNRCNVTVNVVGTITTNGRGGPVSYQWLRSGDLTSPVAAVTASAGHATTRVYLRWTFHGSGTYHATAELRVLTPDVASGHTAFSYSCAG